MEEVKHLSFWRSFWQTLKESKSLLLKFSFTAIFWSILSILYNLLDTGSLTYLNACVNIFTFANIIGIGVSAGVSVLVNQNIKDHKKVQFFASAGFYFSVVFGLVMAVLLAVFAKNMMSDIMGVGISDYTFYFIGCAYFFMYLVMTYLSSLLRFVKAYIASSLCDIFTVLSAVLICAILLWTNNFTLIYISIAYIAMGVVGLILGIVFLAKNKHMKINIFNIRGDKLSWKQFSIIFINTIIEMVLQIGTFSIAIYFLRSSEAAFNTMSYLDVILDIIGGLFYCVITVFNIKTTRALGENDFDGAYKLGKHSILSMLVIWGIYVAFSWLLCYPIALGANKAYFDIMFVSILLYNIYDLFRYVKVCLVTYILRTGGKSFVPSLAYGIYMTMTLALCLIPALHFENIWFLYLCAYIPEIVVLAISLAYFFSRRWMHNINQNIATKFDEVKVFIFDFDGALGYNLNWLQLNKLLNEYFYEHFSYLSIDTVNLLLHPYGKKYGDSITLNELENILMETEGTTTSWKVYRQNHHLFQEEERTISITDEQLQEFKESGAKIYLISNYSKEEMQAFLGLKGVDKSLFNGMYLKTNRKSIKTKNNKIKLIMRKEKAINEETFIVGDNFSEDVLIARSLKLNYFKFEDKLDVGEIFNEKARG